MESCKITFYPPQKSVVVPRGTTILEAAVQAKIKLNAPCGGTGQCGRCRVKIEDGQALVQPYAHLTSQEISKGICLACMTKVEGNLRIFIPKESLLGEVRPQKELPKAGKDQEKIWQLTPLSKEKPYGLALDIGTTTVVANLIRLEDGKSLSTHTSFNAQNYCGSDVISRIVYAKNQKRQNELKNLIIGTINELVEQIFSVHKIESGDIGCISCAGNTTMIYLLLGKNPQPIREDPFIRAQFDSPFTAKDLGLNVFPEAAVYLIPGVGSFVGGDITAGILSVGMNKSNEVSLYIDIGTNGEVALGNKDWLVSASCSAGPAFEGGGVGCGQPAVPGAIEKVKIESKNLKPSFQVINDEKATGICGSGMIDLLAEMFRCHIIDRIGKIDLDLNNERLRIGKKGKEYVLVWGKDTATGEDITINEVDIDNLVRTKAAVFAGQKFLLSNLSLSFDKITQIYIAGAFGNYLDINHGVAIGLFPGLSLDKFKFVGNGSLAGAQLCLLFENSREDANRLSAKITYLDLASSSLFMDEYTAALFLPHTDLSLFPSQKENS